MSSPLDRLPKNGDIIDFTTKEPSSNLQVYLETRNNFEYAHELAKKPLQESREIPLQIKPVAINWMPKCR